MEKLCDKICDQIIDDIKLQINEKIINVEDIGLKNDGLIMIAFCSIIHTHYIRNGIWKSMIENEIEKDLENSPKIELGLEYMDYLLEQNSMMRNGHFIMDITPVKIGIYDKVSEIIEKDYGKIINILKVSETDKINGVKLICSQKEDKISYKIRIDIEFEKEFCMGCSTDEKIKINDYLCKEICFELKITK